MLVQDQWIGANYVDLQHRVSPIPSDLPFVPGTEAAGTVVATGPGVDPDLIGKPVVHFGHLRRVYAEVYDERPGHGSGYYAYFSGIPADTVELAVNKGHFVGLFQTNDGQVCQFAGKDDEPAYRP